MSKVLAWLLSLAMAAGIAGCGNTSPDGVDRSDAITIAIEMMDGGVMTADIYPHVAPETVDNFVKLIDQKFYDGLIFHRVIPEFMIQGGGYDEKMQRKETQSIKGEFTSNGFTNMLSHKRGVLSMARTNIPDSASSQFFIVNADSTFLDGEYAAFGMLTDGFDVLDKISATQTTIIPELGMQDVPVEPQIIKTIRIVK